MRAKFNRNGIIVDNLPCDISLKEPRFYSWTYDEIYEFVMENYQKTTLSLVATKDEIIQVLSDKRKESVIALAMDIDETNFFLKVRSYDHFSEFKPYKDQTLFQLIE